MKKRLFIILAVAALLIAGTVAAVSAVSTEKAADVEAAALAHAGVTQPDWVRSEYDVDDGIPQWEVEFYADGWEYDYVIHAETGQIIAYDKEYDGPKPTASSQTKPAEDPTVPADPAPARLTAGEAEAAALAHAGVTQPDWIRSEYDVDDGIPQWEVEFWADGWEYDYVIHAETGQVLGYDKEQQTPKPTEPAAPAEPTPPVNPIPPADPAPTTDNTTVSITAAEAEALALAHAGLTADQVTRLHSEYDVDDGVPQYEVEFHHDGWEYEYEVHAETGKILHSETDWDD